jgi:hypothetical protein
VLAFLEGQQTAAVDSARKDNLLIRIALAYFGCTNVNAFAFEYAQHAFPRALFFSVQVERRRQIAGEFDDLDLGLAKAPRQIVPLLEELAHGAVKVRAFSGFLTVH